jgi:HEAT repeat protein
MELLVALAVVGLIVGGGVVWNRFAEPMPSPWLAVAEACGLTEVQAPSRFSRDLVGRLGGLRVQFGSYDRTRFQKSSALVVQGLSLLVAFKREGLGSRIDKALGGKEIQIGDEAFDRALYIQGDERLLRALLDAETRRLLMDAFSRGIGFEGTGDAFNITLAAGSLHALFFDAVDSDPLPSVQTVRTLLDLATRLQEPSDPSARLAENRRGDPLPGVRREALRMMERAAPADPATRAEMERAAGEDPDGGVRLQAALWLGPEGKATLEALAVDGTVEDAVSARAIEELGERLAVVPARRVLEESVSAGRVLTAAAIAVVLGRVGKAEAAPLAHALERASGPAAVAVARALGRTGSPLGEPALLAALDRDDDALKAAAAAALGDVGSAGSILPLRELAQASRGRLRSAALDATGRIRARLTGADPGQLSLAAGPDGHLALTEDEHGRVTLPDPQDSS